MRILAKTVLLTACLVASLVANAQSSWTEPATDVVSTTDKVGIGTTTPGADLGATQEAPLHVKSTNDLNTFVLVENTAIGLNAAAVFRTKSDSASQNFQSHASTRTLERFGVTLGGWNEFLSVSGNGLIFGTLLPKPIIFGTGTNTGATVNRMQIAATGEVGIGTAPVSGVALTVNGTVTGTNIKAHYQDLAEWVPSNSDLAPGTVVVLDPAIGNGIMASSVAYDTAVAGVVSEQPGIILGIEGKSKEQIATTGRVRVKVDASRGAIAVADLLVTSDKPGYAMRSTPIEVGGASIHRPATIVGKALEPLTEGTGEILVLLSLQ